jgi:hypothetical protein
MSVSTLTGAAWRASLGGVTVLLLAACSGNAKAPDARQGTRTPTAPRASDAQQSTAFRFVKAPIAIYAADAGHSAQWAIVVRVNTALPTGADRRPRADLRIDHNPSEAGPSRVGSRTGRACYVAAYSSENDKEGPPQLVKPRAGKRVTITLYFNKHKSIDASVRSRHAKVLSAVNTREGIQPYLASLGCLE